MTGGTDCRRLDVLSRPTTNLAIIRGQFTYGFAVMDLKKETVHIVDVKNHYINVEVDSLLGCIRAHIQRNRSEV